jgi:anti-anti-sigma factor
MGTDRLAVEFERQADGGVVLRVSGKLERSTAALLDGILQALWADPSPVTLDLTKVDQIDSRGLDILLGAEASARERNASVAVVGVRESLRAHRPLEPE